MTDRNLSGFSIEKTLTSWKTADWEEKDEE
jgi:hypothetical protein